MTDHTWELRWLAELEAKTQRAEIERLKEKHYLCRNLKLSIQWIHNNQLRLTLANDLSLDQVQLDLEVNDPPLGGSRSYENREAIIIGMRRVVNSALKAGLISDSSPGGLTSLNAGGADIAMTFTTNEEF